MLRIHFTPRDLASTTVSMTAAPLWEVLLSLHMLQHDGGRLVFDGWRRQVLATVPADELRKLLDLTPATGYSPDFLTPTDESGEFVTGLERTLATSRRVIRNQLAVLGKYRAATSWTRELADGDRRTMGQLGRAIRKYHDAAIAPYWRSISTHVAAENGTFGDRLASLGVDEVLACLHPRVRWTPPVLQVLDMNGPDVYLEGRGIKLQPSAFCWQAPTKLLEPDRQPILVFPIAHPPGLLQPASGSGALAALLGSTRAAALEACLGGCTTTELARRCKVTIGAASYHAGVLREAGLITTCRAGSSVRHGITQLGLRLLAGPSIS